jgi:hypothetical protein
MAKRVIRRKRTRAADHQETKKGASHRRTHAEEPENTGHDNPDGSASRKTGDRSARQTVADALHQAGESLGMGGDEDQASESPALELGLLGRLVYHSSYILTYGAVYPVALVAGFIPRENALVYGLLDGASDAQEAAGRWKTSLRSTGGGARPALTGEPA